MNMEIFVVCRVQLGGDIEEYDPIEAYLDPANARERTTDQDDLEVRRLRVVDADENDHDRLRTAESRTKHADGDDGADESMTEPTTAVSTQSEASNRLYITVETGTEGTVCPVCETPVDTDQWTERDVTAGDRGGAATYRCPTSDCPGEATILW
ncbi:MAG: hypothetical protein ABEI76_08665 [Halobacteriales archaeon]